jgi:hypothetical protein
MFESKALDAREQVKKWYASQENPVLIARLYTTRRKATGQHLIF